MYIYTCICTYMYIVHGCSIDKRAILLLKATEKISSKVAVYIVNLLCTDSVSTHTQSTRNFMCTYNSSLAPGSSSLSMEREPGERLDWREIV